jgi:hypothetical protein
MRELRTTTVERASGRRHPWINAVQRATCNLRAEVLAQLY